MESSITNLIQAIGLAPNLLIAILFSIMVAILFLQSGLDKIFNWKGELGFYKDHFKNTFLGPMVGLLMPIITISELLAGILSLVGIIVLLFGGGKDIAILGMLFATFSIIQLFLGQRVAKDYAGAATLIPYFFLCIIGLGAYIA